MSIFICEKCGRLDNTACSNNYWHASHNKHRNGGEELDKSFKPEFEYFENHVCCSDCCDGIEYRDGSGVIRKGPFDVEDKPHWTDIGKDKLLEWEARHDGSMVNATEYFREHPDE